MICLDKLTYGGTLNTLLAVMKKPNFRFDKEDICDIAVVFALFEEEKPDAVINESWWSEIISGEYQNYYEQMYGDGLANKHVYKKRWIIPKGGTL